jgi:hypothetical protein
MPYRPWWCFPAQYFIRSTVPPQYLYYLVTSVSWTTATWSMQFAGVTAVHSTVHGPSWLMTVSNCGFQLPMYRHSRLIAAGLSNCVSRSNLLVFRDCTHNESEDGRMFTRHAAKLYQWTVNFDGHLNSRVTLSPGERAPLDNPPPHPPGRDVL